MFYIQNNVYGYLYENSITHCSEVVIGSAKIDSIWCVKGCIYSLIFLIMYFFTYNRLVTLKIPKITIIMLLANFIQIFNDSF